jgi:hydroxypyruvate reductase
VTDSCFADRATIERTPTHAAALGCLAAGIDAALPASVVDEAVAVESDRLSIAAVDGTTTTVDLDAYDRIFLLGAGKAANGLASALADRLDSRIDGGAVVTTDPDDAAGEPFAVLPGDHPRPTARGAESATRVREIAGAAGERDLVLVALTGGGSAILAAPPDGIPVAALRELTDELLASGAAIEEVNAVRKHCSAVKGGRLTALAAPARVVTVAVSDVVGDDPAVIASGPTTPDPTTFADAIDVTERYDLDLPSTVDAHLRAGVAGARPETPTASHPAFDRASGVVLANGETALTAAAHAAAQQGYDATIVAVDVEGDAGTAGREHAALAERCVDIGEPASPPAVLLSGGETTVRLSEASAEPGAGGPNTEFVVRAGLALDHDGVVVAAVDTDGIDGVSDAAGGIVDAETLTDKAAREALARHDTASLLADADALIRTGPTGTNVNDLRAVVVDPGVVESGALSDDPIDVPDPDAR